MTDLVQEISENYLVDDTELVGLESELFQLLDYESMVRRDGSSPAILKTLKASNLLSGTSFDALALEHISHEPQGGPETDMALEGLGEKIKDKVSEWSSKIIAFSKSSAAKILGVIEPIWIKIGTLIKDLSKSAWDKTKTLGKTIKAHPFKTVIVAVTAAAAVAGVVAFVAHNMEGAYANETALQSFMYKMADMINGIRPVSGTVNADVVMNGANIPGIKVVYEKVTTAIPSDSRSLAELGWTQTATKATSFKLSQIWDMLKKGLYTIGLSIARFAGKALDAYNKYGSMYINKVEKAADYVSDKTGSNVAGAVTIYAGFFALYMALTIVFRLIVKIIATAFTMVHYTLSSVKHAIVG